MDFEAHYRMSGVENKLICLNLNSVWQPIGYKMVRDAISDLVGGEYLAINIEYEKIEGGYDFSTPKSLDAISWGEWIKLPIREFDFQINSKTLCVRVPTVLIAKNYSKMPRKRLSLNTDNIRIRDKNACQYTGKILTPEEGSVDHIIPKAKGGKETWENLVFCDKKINLRKGNMLNEEIGLKLIKEPKEPLETPAYALIEERHGDWRYFLIK